MDANYRSYKKSLKSLVNFKSARICNLLKKDKFDEEKTKILWDDFIDMFGDAATSIDFTCEEDMILSSKTVDALKFVIHGIQTYYGEDYSVQKWLMNKINQFPKENNVNIDTFNYTTLLFLQNLESHSSDMVVKINDIYNPDASDEYNDAAETFLQNYYIKSCEIVKNDEINGFIDNCKKFLEGKFDTNIHKNFWFVDDDYEIREVFINFCVDNYNNLKYRKNFTKLFKILKYDIKLAEIKNLASSLTKSASRV